MREPFEIIESLGLPKPNGVFQIGANTGQEIELFNRQGIKFAALVEPLAGPFQRLQQRCSEYKNYLPIQVLCGSKDGAMVKFHVASNNGESSSIFKPTKHLIDYPIISFSEIVESPTFTLDSVLRALTANRPEIALELDMLYMDVQGGELEVLKGGNSTLHKVRYIYTEVGFGDGYEGAVELTELLLFLKLYGFRLYELEMNTAGWGNAFFVRPS